MKLVIEVLQDVAKIREDDKTITLIWKRKEDVEYILLGMNDYSCYEVITKSEKNSITIKRELLKNYHNYKVDYIYDNNKSKKSELLNIRSIKSYKGYTLSIDNDKVYDLYKIYKKINNKYKLILITEDFIITSNLFDNKSTYYIEAYIKEKDDNILKAKSKEFKIDPITIDSKDKKISVVIPMYNRELYISRCIDSILLSTFNNIELILVNDCSSDNTSKILKWYKNTYKNIITVINNKDNSGVSVSRNKGIEVSCGDYISFIDSDDYIHSSMYEKLYNLGVKEQLDVVISKVIIREKPFKYSYYLDNKEDVIYTYDEMFNKIHTKDNIYFASSCNRIVKTNYVKELLFPNLRCYEDISFTRSLYSRIDRFGYINNTYYVWDKRNSKIFETLSSRAMYGKFDIAYHNMYIDALTYVFKTCNKERLESITYSNIYDIYDFFINKELEKNSPKLFNIYKAYVIGVNNIIDLLSNKYIKKDKELYKYIKNLLKEK